MDKKNEDMIMQNRIFLWIALATGALLLIPLVAMQFTSDVRWEVSDFIMMGVMIFVTSSLFVAAARKVQQKNRLIIGVVCLFMFLWIWAELAVGVFTNWGS